VTSCTLVKSYQHSSHLLSSHPAS